MGDFLQALLDPEVVFLRYALFAGLLASVAFGIVGSYVVVKRISYIAGAISHCVLGGIGAALFLQKKMGIAWCDPMLGAVTAAIGAAVLIGTVSLYARQREDTVIGALWVTGMAAGILLIVKTPGYVDPMSYLFGNIIMISGRDLVIIGILDAVIIVLSLLFYNKLLAVCFDEEFARLRGIHANGFYILLLCLTALTIVLLVRLVGIIMVIALLTLPAAIAAQVTRRLWQMMVAATIICMVCVSGGLALSYGPDLPGGATIVLLAGVLYLAVISCSVVGSFVVKRSL
ncbi:MAG: metal ABC transporter permease [Deltaproteobacteria bacterium]|nr:metal ABC transporter permease [Deltaproteobacteria bacterium]